MTKPPRRTIRRVNSTHRCSTGPRFTTRRNPSVRSERPSSSKMGKKYQPWWDTSHFISRLRGLLACSGVIAMAPRATSGSEPTLFGLAWCLLCLFRHQP